MRRRPSRSLGLHLIGIFEHMRYSAPSIVPFPSPYHNVTMPNPKPALLQLIPISVLPDAAEQLAQSYDVIKAWEAADLAAAINGRADDITVVVTSAMTPTRAALIDSMPNLKAICSHGVGFDSIDVRHAQAKGIQVSNTPDVLNDCVADLAWGLILSTARSLGAAERYVRAGQWGNTALPLSGVRVTGKNLGIIGLGRVGRAIAERSAGFRMPVRYYGRKARPDAPWEFEPSLTELARWADFLVVATVGGESTRNLVNASVLEALGPEGILINIARGSVVDERALQHALETRSIRGAGLDVFQNEPNVPPALTSLDNVVLLPHIASATIETRQAMVQLVLDNVKAFATTERVITPIEPQ